MAIRNILDYLGIVIGQMELPDDTPEEVWQAKLAPYAIAPPTPQEVVISQQQEKIRLAKLFADSIIVKFQVWAENESFTPAQRIWFASRLRSIPVTVAVGVTANVDLIDLLSMGGIIGALEAVKALQFDDGSKPYHAIQPYMVTELRNAFQSYLGLELT